MLQFIPKSALASSLLLFLPRVWADCNPFGVDFQEGNTYFQNSLSTEDFTYVSRFEGCENGFANNVLIDPNGDQYQCSDTTLKPDDTPQLSICPVRKTDLFSGLWYLETISNNGNGTPIANQRAVSLVVGPQATVTYTPTVTLPLTVTPIINITSETTFTSTTLLSPVTVTKPSTTLRPTVTSTPHPVTTTVTRTLLTVTIIKPTLSVKKAESTITASCITPARQESPDPTATITPTIAGITAAALEAQPTGARFRRYLERRVRLAKGLVNKRAPDFPTITLTETNTAVFVTTTSTTTAPVTTITVISTITAIATSTPAPVTVFSGVSSSAVVTVTAPTVTKTRTKLNLVGFVTKVKTVTQRVTIKTTTTPASVAASCTSIGGKLQ